MHDALHPLPSHPSDQAFIVKLHRDADAASGVLYGRIEHIASGRCAVFASADELPRLLASLLRSARPEQDPNGTIP